MNLVERLNICANDPMWCEHAEVPKSLLREAAAALEAAREYAAEADRRVGEQFNKAQRSEAYALEKAAETLTLTKELEAARVDAGRLVFLATDGCVEGFVGVEKDIYEYACDVAEESGRDEPNNADMLGGIRRLVDAAIGQARGKGGQEVGVSTAR